MTPTVDQRSALAGWVLAIIKAMQANEVDAEAVMAEIGMDPALLEGGYSRYSQVQLSKLWKRAVELSGNPAFGLAVAQQVRPATFHAVGHAMSCSATLYRAISRFAQYTRLISDSATATLTENEGRVMLDFHFDTGSGRPIYETVDTVLASVVAFLRWISDQPFDPLEVRIAHEPSASAPAYAAFFGCPVIYETPQTCLVFDKEHLLRRILSSDEELASLLDAAAHRFLEQRMAGRFAVRVRDLMISQLPDEVPTKARTASLLGMTERTLLRRLKDEGATFAGVLRQLREELAFQYLRRGMCLSEVAYLLGFSDNGTFSRAFKEWTGRRPSTIGGDLPGG
ncbi:MAG: AraC family transcriptional regulator [Novosphingobium sp.]